jgi:hypothetical protein
LGLGRFFSFLIQYTVGMTPWRGISPSQGLCLQTEQDKHRINAHNIDILAFSVIRIRDPSVRASEDSSCLTPRGHCDWRFSFMICIINHTASTCFSYSHNTMRSNVFLYYLCQINLTWTPRWALPLSYSY